MKVLIVDRYYQVFLDAWWAAHPDLSERSFAEQRKALMGATFGTSDFYSQGLKALGVEAEEIVVNAEELQAQWAREHGFTAGTKRRLTIRPRSRAPFVSFIDYLPPGLCTLQGQAAELKPDIVYVQDAGWLPQDVIRDLKAHCRLIVAQHASPLPRAHRLRGYDLVVSSLPNQVSYFRSLGLAAEYLPLAFGRQVLERLSPSRQMQYDMVHVGGYGQVHRERDEFLEALADTFDVDCWGYGRGSLRADSPIRRRFHGEAWGLEMYAIRQSSKFTLTKHITSVAGPYANNCTLFESTGVGTCLVVDRKDNLASLFDPDREVVSYASVEECKEKLGYLLDHEPERAAIARAGQARTLRDHTYGRRMEQLLAIFKNRLA